MKQLIEALVIALVIGCSLVFIYLAGFSWEMGVIRADIYMFNQEIGEDE